MNNEGSPAYGLPSIIKTKGDRLLASKSTKARHKNYGYGSVYVRQTKQGISRYYIDYRDRNGERIQRVAKYATSWEGAVSELKDAILKEHVKESPAKKKPVIKFKDFAQVYLRDYAMVKKRAWQSTDKVYLNANLLPYFGDHELTEITPLLVERFIAKRVKDGVMKSTINRDLSCLKKMFNKAIDWNYLNENPLTKIKLFTEKDNVRGKVLSEEEEARLLSACPPHLKSILIFALNTGMRLGEILNLQWNRIDFEARRIRIEKTKSGKTRFVPINDVLFDELNRLAKENGQSPFVFTNPKTGMPPTTIKTALRAACRRSGLERIWCRDMRRTFATRILQKGADIETVRSLLGHYSISVTQRYVHSNEEKRREAVELLRKGDKLLHQGDMKQNEDEDRGVTCLFSVN